MKLSQIHNPDELLELVEYVGFLPFFANEIEGFSVEDCCPRELWFADDADGPWEWKGPAARSRRCVYGKFFHGKAGFVSLAWFPDFANYRRDGYDFDARYEDELASYKDKGVYDVIADKKTLLSQELKTICNYCKGGNKGFDTVITRLQMQTYVAIADFVYKKDRHGKPYGWGIAKYSTPEELLGCELVKAAYKRKPEESKERIYEHLAGRLPGVSDKQILQLMR